MNTRFAKQMDLQQQKIGYAENRTVDSLICKKHDFVTLRIQRHRFTKVEVETKCDMQNHGVAKIEFTTTQAGMTNVTGKQLRLEMGCFGIGLCVSIYIYI